MDDDLQNPPEEVVRLFDHARTANWDVVYTRYAVKQHAGWRNLGSRFANKVADVLLDKPKGLYLSSFRCMSALVVRAVTQYSGPYPYIDGLIMQVTRRIDSIEVRHLPRIEGRSNYNLVRLVRLWLNLATSFSLAPLRLAVFAGAAMAAAGAIGAVATIVETLFLNQTPTGWASTMVCSTLLVGGVLSMVLGVLGEYVGRTFLTANGKPQGAVRIVERNDGGGLDQPIMIGDEVVRTGPRALIAANTSAERADANSTRRRLVRYASRGIAWERPAATFQDVQHDDTERADESGHAGTQKDLPRRPAGCEQDTAEPWPADTAQSADAKRPTHARGPHAGRIERGGHAVDPGHAAHRAAAHQEDRQQQQVVRRIREADGGDHHDARDQHDSQHALRAEVPRQRRHREHADQWTR